jgi:hypothetical protein
MIQSKASIQNSALKIFLLIEVFILLVHNEESYVPVSSRIPRRFVYS